MFFRIELLNKFSHGRFCESWLAATSPTLFRRHYSKNNVLKISVTKICNDIQEMWNTNSDQVKDRLSLFLASQLLYGTVCIHQQQAHFLYEATLVFYLLEREMTKLVRHNVPRIKSINAKQPVSKPKRVPKGLNLTSQLVVPNENIFLIEDHGLVAYQSQKYSRAQEDLEKSVAELLQEPDNLSVENALITMIEEPIPTSHHDMDGEIHANELQIFNDPEYCEFMLFNEDLHQAKRFKLQETPSSIFEVPLENPSKILCYSNPNLVESSIDLINRVNRSATTSYFDHFYQQINTGSTPLRDEHQPDPFIDNLDNRPKLQNTIVAGTTIESVIEIIQPPESEKDAADTLAPPLRTIIKPRNIKAGKKRLKVDSIIELADLRIYNNIQDYSSTLRVSHPTEDVMSPWNIELRCDIFRTPVNNILAIPLCNEYKRRLITNPVAVDTDIFNGLINPFELTSPRQDYTKRRAEKRTHDDRIVKPVEAPPVEIQLSTETVPMIMPPEITLPNELEINPPPNPVMETTDIPSYLPESLSELTDSMAKHQFGKTEVYRRLEVLWKQPVYPIGVHTLCEGLITRKYVAMVFYSLLCLQKDGLVKLTCKSDNREIYHIEQVV